jgi:acyl carrier protein
MEFEKEFDIAIPDDQAEKISTVGDAIAYIENNTK